MFQKSSDGVVPVSVIDRSGSTTRRPDTRQSSRLPGDEPRPTPRQKSDKG
jgi:hypothetical protein